MGRWGDGARERIGGTGGSEGYPAGMSPVMQLRPQKGQCLRIVPSRLADGALQSWLAAHREQHTPEVRRQPGFVAKALIQSEENPDIVAMLLLWQTSEQADHWRRHPQHDVVSAPLRPFTVQGQPRATLGHGGYRLLEDIIEPADR